MFDTINLERKDIPAVVLVHDRFEKAARAQAKISGLSSLKIVAIPEGIPGESPAELPVKIDRLWDEIIGALVISK